MQLEQNFSSLLVSFWSLLIPLLGAASSNSLPGLYPEDPHEVGLSIAA